MRVRFNKLYILMHAKNIVLIYGLYHDFEINKSFISQLKIMVAGP